MQFADEVKSGNNVIALMGPPKQGKTVTAASISKFFPDVLPSPEKVYLKDTVFLQVDSNGVLSLKQLNVFPMLVDLSDKTSLKDLMPALDKALADIKPLILAGEVRFVVFDTLTALDKIIVAEKQKQIMDKRVWNAILGVHMDIAMKLKSLPCTVVVIAHTKYIGAFAGDETPEMVARKKAMAMPGRAEIGFAMSSGPAEFWITQADSILPVYTKLDGKTKRYTVLTEPTMGFACGHRYKGLSEEEPAHLRKLLQKAGAY